MISVNVSFGGMPGGMGMGGGMDMGGGMQGIPSDFSSFSNPDVPVRWTGKYLQNGQPVQMSIDRLSVDVTGRISGDGGDQVGSFSMSGQIFPNGTFQMIKQYHGRHAVNYNGVVGNGTLSGQWSLQAMRGDFDLQFAAEEWKGSFSMNGQNYPMKTRMLVNEQGAFGLGKDNEGVYVIKGSYNRGSNSLTFGKSYLGKYSIEFSGQMFNDGNWLIVRGDWRLSTGQSGQFELMDDLPGGNKQQMVSFYQPPPPPQNFVPQFYGVPPQQVPQHYQQMPNYQPPQYYGAQQPHAVQQPQLSGPLDDMDFIDGDKEDVQRVTDKLRRGKYMTGDQLFTWLQMIKHEGDLEAFVKFLTKDHFNNELSMEAVVTAMKEITFQNKLPVVGIHLYRLVTTEIGAIEQNTFLGLFVFQKDKVFVKQQLGI
jgi:hypothetical protein